MVKTKEDMTGWNMWEHGVPDSKLTVIKQTDDLQTLLEGTMHSGYAIVIVMVIEVYLLYEVFI